jgi:dipeptidyl aminopeptidase/acylaminoacyl peptidase
MKQTKSFGSWKSPITAELVTKAAPSLDQPQFDSGNLYWLESRPWENGRCVIMRRQANGVIEDALPVPLGARSRVHEYGGAPYLVTDNVIYFCLDHDQRVYRFDLSLQHPQPEALTANDNRRYTDLALDKHHQRLIATCEEHREDSHLPENFLVTIPLDGSQQVTTLTSGDDFYSNARISPDGKKISWLCWQHPNMPWDETELWCADLNVQGLPCDPKLIADGNTLGKPESIFQPQWSNRGDLYFASDRNNWWNLYRQSLNQSADQQAQLICDSERNHDSEFAMPQWVFGMSTFGFLDVNTIACSYTHNGFWHFAIIDLNTGQLTDIDTPYTSIQGVFCHQGQACFIGASANLAPEVVTYQKDATTTEVAYQSGELPVEQSFLATPQAITFNSGDGQAHAFLYPPTNPNFCSPKETNPPLVAMCHGGPTAACDSALSFKIQYWTSRGFMVIDINYRGSTGFGRRYRDALKGQWGIIDVEDAVNAANYLVHNSLVDPQKMAIRGGSAGGYSVLCALTFHDTFKAGASLYGIGDLELLVAGTHKFEAHYTDSLIGPYPEEKALYQARSPIHHIDQLTCPVIFLQGLDDKVVPPNQAELMVNALQEKHIPVAYVAFEGEGHGFRKAQNIKKALESELYFYSKIFDFQLPETVAPITIKNLAIDNA